MSRLCQNSVNPAIKVERSKRSLPDVSSSEFIIPWKQPKGKDQRTLQIEYPRPEFILPGRCTAKTSVWKTERAYQRGENVAVRFWGRKVYGVWPRNNQQGHRRISPFLSVPKFIESGFGFYANHWNCKTRKLFFQMGNRIASLTVTLRLCNTDTQRIFVQAPLSPDK